MALVWNHLNYGLGASCFPTLTMSSSDKVAGYKGIQAVREGLCACLR